MRGYVDRYHEAGLRRNPFVARQIGDPPVAFFVDRGVPAPPAPGSATLFQVIGESGFGKSTHLDHWRTGTPAPYHYIVRAPYRQRWMEPPVESLVYGDEIDRMPRPLRRRWFRDLAAIGATVVVGTHRDLAVPARRAGLAVQTHRLEPMDATTLIAIVNGRIDAASTELGKRSPFRFDAAELNRLLQRSGGVPRVAEVIAHQMVADRVLPSPTAATRPETP